MSSTMTSQMTSKMHGPGRHDGPIDLLSRRTARLTLPRRFDIHEISRFTDELGEHAHIAALVVIDGSQVEMIDLAAIVALEELLKEHNGLRIIEPSVALRATIRYTGHDRLAAICQSESFPEAA